MLDSSGDIEVEQLETQSKQEQSYGGGVKSEGAGLMLSGYADMNSGSDKVVNKIPEPERALADSGVMTRKTTEEESVFEHEPFRDEAIVEETFVKEDSYRQMSKATDVTDLLIAKLKLMTDMKGNDQSKSLSNLSWSKEYENSDGEARGSTVKIGKTLLPKHLTSSVASESARYPSGADSIENMIDNVVLETRNLSYKVPEISLDNEHCLTPMTPVSEALFETKSADYKLAYISDDNLETDLNEVFVGSKSPLEMVENKTDEKESRKKELQAMGSLDRLLSDQGDFVDYSQTDVGLEDEFQHALRYSSEDDPELVYYFEQQFGEENKSGKPGNSEIVSTNENIFKVKSDVKDKHCKAKQETRKAEQNSDLNTISKPKLASKSSLDILVDEQGSYIDTDNAEFDKELLESLEKQFNENIKKEKADSLMNSEYAFLGMSHKTDIHENNPGASVQNTDNNGDNGFDELADTALAFLDVDAQKKANKPNKAPSKECKDTSNNRIQHSINLQRSASSSSSDSDMLSVIEEVDETDAVVGSPKGENVESCEEQRPLYTEMQGTDISYSKEHVADPETSASSVNTNTKEKIFQIVKGFEKAEIDSKTNSGGKSEEQKDKADPKSKEKFKKLNEHWHAVEKHEADILDFELEDTDCGDKHLEDIHAGSEIGNSDLKGDEQHKVTSPENADDILNSTVETSGVVMFRLGSISESIIEDNEDVISIENDGDPRNDPSQSGMMDVSSFVSEHEYHNSTSLGDSNPQCHSLLSIGDDSEEANQHQGKDTYYLCASINDSKNLCYSIDSEKSAENAEEQPNVEYIVQANSSKDEKELCHVSDIEACKDFLVEESGVLQSNTKVKEQKIEVDLNSEKAKESQKRTMNVSQSSCKTISSDGTSDIADIADPYPEFVSDHPQPVEQNQSNNFYSTDMKTDVCHSTADSLTKLKDVDEQLTFEAVEGQYGFKQEGSVSPDRQSIYTTEVQLVLESGKVTSPSEREAQFFKSPPVRPPRTKKITILTTSKTPLPLDSPPLLTPSDIVDSPRTGIECIC